MEYATIILSGLALLVVTVNLIMTIREKKRNQKRNAATLQYLESLEKSLAGNTKDAERMRREISLFDEKLTQFSEKLGSIEKITKDLSKGIVPDYEEAVRAKDAVDTLSSDIAAILGFDPLLAAKEARLQRRTTREVD